MTVGQRTYPVAGDTWEDYRCELMVRVSQERLLAAAKRVNPKARLIIKYPQWYDQFHERGYEVLRETADFDRTWVGTETRDYGDKHWGGTPQYEGYFIMRWLGGIGGAKCGGGWYDPYGTTERTYLEQARQTVLGGAGESMLFCYGSLLEHTGPKNIETLRQNIPELLGVAEQVGHRPIIGVAAYKPANSHPENERRVFDFIGMIGLPLVPCHEFPVEAPAAFFSIHALKDPELPAKLARFIASGKPVLLTDGLAKRLAGKVDLTAANVQVIPVRGDPKRLLELPQKELDALRLPLLRSLGPRFVPQSRRALPVRRWKLGRRELQRPAGRGGVGGQAAAGGPARLGHAVEIDGTYRTDRKITCMFADFRRIATIRRQPWGFNPRTIWPQNPIASRSDARTSSIVATRRTMARGLP